MVNLKKTSNVAIIPATVIGESGSEFYIQALQDRPLIAYSIQAARLSGMIDRIFVLTDSLKVAEVVPRFEAEIPYINPPELCKPKASMRDNVKHFLNWIKQTEQWVPECVFVLSPNTPVRRPEVIDEALIYMQQHRVATSLYSVQPMPESAYGCFEIIDGVLTPIGREKTPYPKTYQANRYVDIYTSRFVMSDDLILEQKAIGFETEVVTEIQRETDLKHIEYQLHTQRGRMARFFADIDYTPTIG